MFIINDSKIPTVEIREFCREYRININEPTETLKLVNNSEGVFIDDSRGLYVTDYTHASAAGLTYTFGAASVYDIAGTLERIKNPKLARKVCLLRIVHECAHHFNLPVDSIDAWFQNHRMLSLIYYLFGHPLGENIISCRIQEIFYKDLFSKIESEEKFTIENNISKRTYTGVLTKPANRHSFNS